MNILLGVTGGIAAYKACELVSLGIKSGHSFEVIMTSSATEFVGPLSFEGLTSKKVHTQTFETAMSHIELGKWADLCCIAPLSANTMAKLANGLCDDLLSTTVLALPNGCPLILAPAMNTNMWSHPATQGNLNRLEAMSHVHFVHPVSKRLACGDFGIGGLANPADILMTIQKLGNG